MMLSTFQPQILSNNLNWYPLPEGTPSTLRWAPLKPYPFTSKNLLSCVGLSKRVAHLNFAGQTLARIDLEELVTYLGQYPFAKGLVSIAWGNALRDLDLTEPAVHRLLKEIARVLEVNRRAFETHGFVSDATCAFLSNEVYHDAGYQTGKIENVLSAGYQLLMLCNENASVKGNGYFGVAYINDATGHIVVAHRGTEGPKRLKEFLSDWETNVADIMLGEMKNRNSQWVSAARFTQAVASVAMQLGYRLTFTGHSLGGWLAQVCLFDLATRHSLWFNQSLAERPRVVVFDSPGAKNAMARLQSHFTQGTFEASRLDIVSYLSRPNLVNTCQSHVGKLYELQVKEPVQRVGVDELLEYTRAMHAMTRLLTCFDPQTGVPRTGMVKSITRWPLIQFKLTGLTLFHRGVFYPLNELLHQKALSASDNSETLMENSHTQGACSMSQTELMKYYMGHYVVEPYRADVMHQALLTLPEQQFLLAAQQFQRRATGAGCALVSAEPGQADEATFLQSHWLKEVLNYDEQVSMSNAVTLVHQRYNARVFRVQLALVFACYPAFSAMDEEFDDILREANVQVVDRDTPQFTRTFREFHRQFRATQRAILKQIEHFQVLGVRPLGWIYESVPEALKNDYLTNQTEVKKLLEQVNQAEKELSLLISQVTPTDFVRQFAEELVGHKQLLRAIDALTQAVLLDVEGKWKEALERLTQAQKRLDDYGKWLTVSGISKHAPYSLLMGRCYQQLGKLSRRYWLEGTDALTNCQQRYQQALIYLPHAKDIQSNLGALLNDHGEWCYQAKGLDSVGEYDYFLHSDLVKVIQQSNTYHRQALEYHREACRLDPFDPHSLRDYGRGLYLLGLSEYQLSEKDTSAHQRYCQCLTDALEKFDESLTLCEEFHQIPRAVDYLFRAIVEMEQARQANPVPIQIQCLQKALATVNKGLKMAPSHASLLRRQALIAYHLVKLSAGTKKDRKMWITGALQGMEQTLEQFAMRVKRQGFLTPEDQVRQAQTRWLLTELKQLIEKPLKSKEKEHVWQGIFSFSRSKPSQSEDLTLSSESQALGPEEEYPLQNNNNNHHASDSNNNELSMPSKFSKN